MSIDSVVDSTVGGAIGAAMAGLWWNRRKKSAAAAAIVAQVVLMRGLRVWEGWVLMFWKDWLCGSEENDACEDEGGGFGVLKDSEEMGLGNDGRW